MVSKAGNTTGHDKPADARSSDTPQAASVVARPARPALDVATPEPAAAASPVKKVAAVAKAVAAKRAAPARRVVKKRPAAAPAKPVAAKAANPIIKAAKSVVTNAARVAASTVQKEKTIMATKFELPKFEAPKLFADFNDKAKSAVEKGTKAFEEANEFTKGNVEALVESGKIAAKGFETLGQDAADYGRKSFESLTAMLKSAASVKSPTDFFKLQSEYVRQSFDAAVAHGSKSTEAFIKLAGDAAQPIQNRLSVAADKVKKAA